MIEFPTMIVWWPLEWSFFLLVLGVGIGSTTMNNDDRIAYTPTAHISSSLFTLLLLLRTTTISLHIGQTKIGILEALQAPYEPLSLSHVTVSMTSGR